MAYLIINTSYKNKMLIVFASVHDTLSAEDLLIINDIEHDVVPIPPNISSGCGLAIETRPDLLEQISSLMEREGIEVTRWISQDKDI